MGRKSFETFAQKASYLFQKSNSNLWYNSAVRTIECTKSALGIIAYTALKYYGNEYYRQYIDSRYDLAKTFSEMVKSDNNFELAVEPQSNIVCFRYAPEGYDEQTINQTNAAIRDKIIRKDHFILYRQNLMVKSGSDLQ